MRKLLVVSVLILATATLMAQSPKRYVTYEKITVADTAIGLSAATYTIQASPGYPATDPNAVECAVVVETAEIRYQLDGTSPTTTTGTLLAAGEGRVFRGLTLVSNLKMIRTTATSATVHANCVGQ